jgi:DNA-binding SARP family transcriptional activator
MIALKTLGVSSIELGRKTLRPSASRAFAALLYACVEAGRQIPRVELQALLYPDHDRASGAHNLRQLLYKLRKLGAPIDSREEHVLLPARLVHADYTALLDAEPPEDAVAAARGGLLPNYAPDFSAPFSDWLDDLRTRISHGIRHTMTNRIAALRAQGRWREMEPLARACLVYDPLSEPANVALAEALAYIGQPSGAVRSIDDYLADLGPSSKDARGRALVLRGRISERIRDGGYRRMGASAFVGRDAEMAELWTHLQRAMRGDARAVVMHGQEGIGKSRLASEFTKAASLDGVACVSAACGANDGLRPMGVFTDLVPRLLESPGALGVSPETLEQLRKLTTREPDAQQPTLGATDPRSASAAIVRAVSDLLDAVASEVPVLVWIDDGHLADPVSLRMVRDLVSGPTARALLVVITSPTRLFIGSGEGHARGVVMIKVRPLGDDAARRIAADVLRTLGSAPCDADVARCVEHASGNPLYIRAAASELGADTGDGRMPRSLTQLLQQRVDQLHHRSLRVLAGCSVLARHATAARLRALVELDIDSLCSALQDLEERGILESQSADLHATHPMLSEIATRTVPAGVLQLLHYRCAEQLEGESGDLSDAALLWDCARHWEQAGEVAKALSLLRSCAAHSVQIGQPRTACDLLQHAERIAPPGLMEPVLEEAIGASVSAERFADVRALIGRYRAVRPTASVHDEYEMLEIEAARWAGVPLRDHRRQLWACLSCPDATLEHRLRAAGMLILYASAWFDPDVAHRAYRLAQQLHAADPSADAVWDNLDLIYKMRFGDPLLTAEAAHRALVSSERSLSPVRAVLLASNAAVGFLVAGSLERAAAAGMYGWQTAQKSGMRTSGVLCAATMASIYWDFDDRDEALRWNSLADAALPETAALNRALMHVSNKIEFAISSGDAVTARYWLDFARTDCGELRSPHNWCIGRGYELLIDQAEGRVTLAADTLDELLDWHTRARGSLSHDPFVEGLWRALAAANRRDAANRMLAEYLGVHRRERYPVRRGLRELYTLQG